MKYEGRRLQALATLARGGAMLAAGALLASGCALTTKADVVDVRYFSPEHVKAHLTGGDLSASPGSPAPGAFDVRLGRVSSGSNLRERIAFRDAAYELGYYEDWRWTERPETFVRRELGRAMFEEHGMHRVFNAVAPTVDIEVIAFDELRLKNGRAARVQLKAMLSDDSGVLWEDTLTVDRPVTTDNPKIEDVVAAMAGALDAAAEQVTAKVQATLAARRAAAPPREP